MDKTNALMNALAFFHYCLFYYKDSIVSLTANGLSYNVNVILDHDDYDSDRELERMKDVIMAGARIVNFKKEGRDYDSIDVTYYYR